MIDCIKFEFDVFSGFVFEEFVICDIIEGDGVEVKFGDIVIVYYVGVEFDFGEEFDLLWGCGEMIQFLLCGLIQGWQDGIFGMKVGGCCEFIILLYFVYGFVGGGYFFFGKMLIFIIDLVVVG